MVCAAGSPPCPCNCPCAGGCPCTGGCGGGCGCPGGGNSTTNISDATINYYNINLVLGNATSDAADGGLPSRIIIDLPQLKVST